MIGLSHLRFACPHTRYFGIGRGPGAEFAYYVILYYNI